MLKNFTVIEVISSKTKAQLSFYPNKFKFNQFTAPDLGNPPYVQFLIDTNGKNFAIRVCEKTDENALAFVKRKQSAKAYPVSLACPIAADMIANLMDWHDDTKYYVIPGQKFPDEKAIVFNLNDADEFQITTRPTPLDNEIEE